MFSLTSDLSFQADFVLATLMEDAASSQQTQVQSQERRLNARTSTPLHRNPTDVSGHAVVSQELSCIDRMVDQVDSVPVEAAASPEMTPRKKVETLVSWGFKVSGDRISLGRCFLALQLLLFR